MSSTSFVKLPKRYEGSGPMRPRPSGRPSSIRGMLDREERRQQAAAAAAKIPARSSRPACLNPHCENPNVVDGTCQNCGRVSDDSNIVNDVQFGETSSGAAMVQGTFLGADQAGVRGSGPGFRRAGMIENKEKTLLDAKRIMHMLATRLHMPEHVANSAARLFQVAQAANFVQGRGINRVAAACFYAACRQERPCRIMLLDIADILKMDVFRLGNTFKAFFRKTTYSAVMPLFPEDLIQRFAMKLEFDHDTNKVATTAVQLVRRMSKDWMELGRRPSGICGACLLLAARIHNYRRTPEDVVPIVKITIATIENRLEEFKHTPVAGITVEEFLAPGMYDLESRNMPPALLKQLPEWKDKLGKKRRKRKRQLDDDGEEVRQGDTQSNAQPGPLSPLTPAPEPVVLESIQAGLAAESTADATAGPSGDPPIVPPPPPLQAEPTRQTMGPPPTPSSSRDAENLALPAIPASLLGEGQTSQDYLTAASAVGPEGAQLDGFSSLFGDHGSPRNEEEDIDGSQADDASVASGQTDTPRKPKGGRGRGRKLPTPEPMTTAEWAADEAELQAQITEMINDPVNEQYQGVFEHLEKQAKARAEAARAQQKTVSSQQDIDPHEFDGDPEVDNCVLPEEDVKAKEIVWLNANRDWLRQQQEKAFRKAMEKNGPPKKRRNRPKKARIGEGQTSPASTPGESAVNAIKARAISKRINYDAIRGLFDKPGARGGQGPGSAVTGSAFTSRAGSTVGGSSNRDLEGSIAVDEEEEEEEEGDEGEPGGEQGEKEFHDEEFEEEEEYDPFADDTAGGGGEDDDIDADMMDE